MFPSHNQPVSSTGAVVQIAIKTVWFSFVRSSFIKIFWPLNDFRLRITLSLVCLEINLMIICPCPRICFLPNRCGMSMSVGLRFRPLMLLFSTWTTVWSCLLLIHHLGSLECRLFARYSCARTGQNHSSDHSWLRIKLPIWRVLLWLSLISC